MKLELTIERGEVLWGRATYEDSLIVDSAESEEAMVDQMKKLLLDFHEVNPEDVEFEIIYE